MTVQRLENMTDAELTTIAGPNPADLSEFTDQELDAIINDTASPALLARVDAAPRQAAT
jgi:hypothetical protein